MQETQEMQVLSLGREDPLEEEVATHSSILAWEILLTDKSLVGYSPWSCKELDMIERLSTHAKSPNQKGTFSLSTRGVGLQKEINFQGGELW